MVVFHQLSVSTALHDLTVGNSENAVDLGEEVQSVGDENPGLTVGVIHKHLVEHRFLTWASRAERGPWRSSVSKPQETDKKYTHVENLDLGSTVDSPADVDTFLKSGSSTRTCVLCAFQHLCRLKVLTSA